MKNPIPHVTLVGLLCISGAQVIAETKRATVERDTTPVNVHSGGEASIYSALISNGKGADVNVKSVVICCFDVSGSP